MSELNEDYIYESPDGGETIYRRKVGEDGRVLVKGSNNIYDKIQSDLEGQSVFLEGQSELSQLRQKVLNLEIENSDLKDMLRDLGVAI